MEKCMMVLTLTAFFAMTSAYPTGAPEEACAFLDPYKGHGTSTAKGPGPFELIFFPTTYRPRERHTLLLRARDGQKFKGFLVEARAMRVKNGTVPVGGFIPVSMASTHAVCTSYKTGNGITHDVNTEKESVQLAWDAPGDVGEIFFYFTVVRGHNGSVYDPADYYKGMRSHPVLPAGGSRLPSIEKKNIE